MAFKITDKKLEWQEITFTGNEFIKAYPILTNDGDYLNYDLGCPMVKFDSYEYIFDFDASPSLISKRLHLSSNRMGIIKWTGESYVRHFHSVKTDLGQLESVAFEMNEHWEKVLESIK